MTRLPDALDWYVRFFGRPPDIVPNEQEVMWQVAGAGWPYVRQEPKRAGQGLVTIAVSDLAAAVHELGMRGIATGSIETVGEGALKARTQDPDGNNLDLIQVAR